MKLKVKSLSRVRPFATLWTVAHQAPPSMEFSRQEYSSGLPFSPPGDLPDQGLNSGLPCCRQTLYPLGPQWIPMWYNQYLFFHVFSSLLYLLFIVVRSLSHVQLWDSHGLQHAKLSRPSPSSGVCLHSCPLSQWCHLTILSSVIPFPSCLQSFPAYSFLPYANMQDIDFCTWRCVCHLMSVILGNALVLIICLKSSS